MNTDTVWKIVSAVASLLIVPLFIWVWNTNVRIEHLSSEFSHTDEDVKKLEVVVDGIGKEQQGIKTDVKLIQQKLDRVEKNTEELLKITKERQ